MTASPEIIARPSEIAAWSRTLLDRPLTVPGELTVVLASERAKICGEWGLDVDCMHLRGGGGASVILAEGSVYVALALAHAGALVADADVPRIMNRYVRPLLAALAKSGARAMYGGRDFVAVKGAPVAWVGFQHSAETKRAAFEAVLALHVPFAAPGRASFRGRAPASLVDAGCVYAASELGAAALAAYTAAYPTLRLAPFSTALSTALSTMSATQTSTSRRSTWVTEEDAIGLVGARLDTSNRLRIGGDFYASRETIPTLERALERAASVADVARIIQETCDAEDLEIVGLTSLDALTRVASAAYRERAK